MGQGQKMAEVEIMRENAEAMLSRPSQDLPIFRSRVSDLRPVDGVDPLGFESVSP